MHHELALINTIAAALGLALVFGFVAARLKLPARSLIVGAPARVLRALQFPEPPVLFQRQPGRLPVHPSAARARRSSSPTTRRSRMKRSPSSST